MLLSIFKFYEVQVLQHIRVALFCLGIQIELEKYKLLLMGLFFSLRLPAQGL